MDIEPGQYRITITEDGDGPVSDAEVRAAMQADVDDTRVIARAKSTDPVASRTLKGEGVQGQVVDAGVVELAERADAHARTAQAYTVGGITGSGAIITQENSSEGIRAEVREIRAGLGSTTTTVEEVTYGSDPVMAGTDSVNPERLVMLMHRIVAEEPVRKLNIYYKDANTTATVSLYRGEGSAVEVERLAIPGPLGANEYQIPAEWDQQDRDLIVVHAGDSGIGYAGADDTSLASRIATGQPGGTFGATTPTHPQGIQINLVVGRTTTVTLDVPGTLADHDQRIGTLESAPPPVSGGSGGGAGDGATWPALAAVHADAVAPRPTPIPGPEAIWSYRLVGAYVPQYPATRSLSGVETGYAIGSTHLIARVLGTGSHGVLTPRGNMARKDLTVPSANGGVAKLWYLNATVPLDLAPGAAAAWAGTPGRSLFAFAGPVALGSSISTLVQGDGWALTVTQINLVVTWRLTVGGTVVYEWGVPRATVLAQTVQGLAGCWSFELGYDTETHACDGRVNSVAVAATVQTPTALPATGVLSVGAVLPFLACALATDTVPGESDALVAYLRRPLAAEGFNVFRQGSDNQTHARSETRRFAERPRSLTFAGGPHQSEQTRDLPVVTGTLPVKAVPADANIEPFVTHDALKTYKNPNRPQVLSHPDFPVGDLQHRFLVVDGLSSYNGPYTHNPTLWESANGTAGPFTAVPIGVYGVPSGATDEVDNFCWHQGSVGRVMDLRPHFPDGLKIDGRVANYIWNMEGVARKVGVPGVEDEPGSENGSLWAQTDLRDPTTRWKIKQLSHPWPHDVTEGNGDYSVRRPAGSVRGEYKPHIEPKTIIWSPLAGRMMRMDRPKLDGFSPDRVLSGGLTAPETDYFTRTIAAQWSDGDLKHWPRDLNEVVVQGRNSGYQHYDPVPMPLNDDYWLAAVMWFGDWDQGSTADGPLPAPAGATRAERSHFAGVDIYGFRPEPGQPWRLLRQDYLEPSYDTAGGDWAAGQVWAEFAEPGKILVNAARWRHNEQAAPGQQAWAPDYDYKLALLDMGLTKLSGGGFVRPTADYVILDQRVTDAPLWQDVDWCLIDGWDGKGLLRGCVEDEQGRVIPGYEMADCVMQSDGTLTWRGSRELPEGYIRVVVEGRGAGCAGLYPVRSL